MHISHVVCTRGVYHGPDVLTGASQYIQQFQQIPAYANISGRIEAESRLNELRGRMREIVRADFQKPGQLTWDILGPHAVLFVR